MEWSRETSWRQGHLLGNDLINELGLHHIGSSEQTVVVVATHDCDLAQHPDREPYVEVVVGRIVERDGNCTHAKNARKLHIEFGGESVFWGEFEITAKISIDKHLLVQYLPRTDAQLTPENHATLQMWLASRYRRSAFPDEFERRLTSRETKLDEKISKAVKPYGELIMGVFFDVDNGEEIARNGEDDTYTLDIIILHSADDNFILAEGAANEAAAAIERAFKEKLFDPDGQVWRKIELRSCEALSESVLTYQEFKRLKRWRLDYISLAAEPQHPALVE